MVLIAVHTSLNSDINIYHVYPIFTYTVLSLSNIQIIFSKILKLFKELNIYHGEQTV